MIEESIRKRMLTSSFLRGSLVDTDLKHLVLPNFEFSHPTHKTCMRKEDLEWKFVVQKANNNL